MKKLKSLLVCGLVLAALAGFTNIIKADAAKRSTKATVRAVHGNVQYSINGTDWMQLRPNMELSEGTMLKSADDSSADLQVNGRTSTVRITANTDMTLKVMDAVGMSMSADSDTQLDMADGTVLGSVKKISGDSTYRVSTPRGVAGIRGTDFQVVVVKQANGLYTVTYTSVTGQVICVANVNVAGVIRAITKVLTTGQSWTPPDTAPTEADIQVFQSDVSALVKLITGLPGGEVIVTPGQGGPGTVVYVPPTTGTQNGGNKLNTGNTPPVTTPPPSDG